MQSLADVMDGKSFLFMNNCLISETTLIPRSIVPLQMEFKKQFRRYCALRNKNPARKTTFFDLIGA